MASEKQIRANQRNAEKSSGPKTKEGKSVSKRNSLKHGLFSSEAVLPWENTEDLNHLRESLANATQPIGELEELLLDKIVSIAWRLRRVGRTEKGILSQKRFELVYNVEESDVERHRKVLGRHVGNEQLVMEIKRSNTRWALENSPDFLDLGVVFAENMIVLSNLQRCEGALERSLFRTMHELERLQASRKGDRVLPPIAVDVHGENP